jgi:hypothetical protein
MDHRNYRANIMPCKGCEERAKLINEGMIAVKAGEFREAHRKIWEALKSAGHDALAAAYRRQFDEDPATVVAETSQSDDPHITQAFNGPKP